jgi:hypothetical protein
MEVTQSKAINWETQSCKQRGGQESLGGATPWSTRSQSNKGAWSELEKDGAERPFLFAPSARLPQVSL